MIEAPTGIGAAATIVLAIVLLGDALASIRPPRLIRDCLNGVKFPESFWWSLIFIKILAGVGLFAGLRYDGVAATTNVAVICYFVAATVAHIRANFMGVTFWINCLGMLGLSVLVLVVANA